MGGCVSANKLNCGADRRHKQNTTGAAEDSVAGSANVPDAPDKQRAHGSCLQRPDVLAVRPKHLRLVRVVGAHRIGGLARFLKAGAESPGADQRCVLLRVRALRAPSLPAGDVGEYQRSGAANRKQAVQEGTGRGRSHSD